MDKIFIFLKIHQMNEKGIRVNPYNPLSYITMAILIIITFLIGGFLYCQKEIFNSNPFNYLK